MMSDKDKSPPSGEVLAVRQFSEAMGKGKAPPSVEGSNSFDEWWENESGWGGVLLSEGQLAKAAWEAGIKSVAPPSVEDKS